MRFDSIVLETHKHIKEAGGYLRVATPVLNMEIRKKRSNRKAGVLEVICIIISVLGAGGGILFLLNLENFYKTGQANETLVKAITIIPIVLVFLAWLMIQFLTGSFHRLVGTWLMTELAISIEIILLILGVIEGSVAIILWLVLICAALLGTALITDQTEGYYINIYTNHIVNWEINVLQTFILIATFALGTYVDLRIWKHGLEAIDTQLRFFLVVPALADFIIAVAYSVEEVL